MKYTRLPRHPGSRTKLWPVLALGVLLVCAASTGCTPGEVDLEARIQRIESGLLPGPGIVIQGRPWPQASLFERMQAYRVPGISIAVIRDFEIEWAKGYGLQSAESEEPVTPQTLFQAASISKPVAAAAALSLVQEGILDLDEDLNIKLRSWSVPENEFTAEKKVTLRGILSHTAGLTVHGFPGYRRDKDVPALVRVLDGEKPANTAPIRVDTVPGTLWRYSGGGYTVMQQLLIDVLDRPFPEILRERVLEPAGMAESTYAQPLPESRHALASRAHLRNGKLVKGEWHTYPEMATAGLWTTPTDLCRFAVAVMEAYNGRSDTLLSRDTVREMLTEVDGRYGLGLSVVREGEKLRFGHGGSNAGFKCTLVAWAHSGDGVAIMTNGDLGSPLMTEILNSLSREYGWPDFSPVEKQVTSVPAGKLAEYAGTYKLKPAGTLKIEVEGGRVFADRLYVIPEGTRRVEIFPESETLFFAVETNTILTFQRDAAGKISGVTMKQGTRTREGIRQEEEKVNEEKREEHRLSGVIEGFHLYSYYAGTVFAAAEFVASDCKQLALSSPYSEKDLETMLGLVRMAADEYGLPIYVEKDFLTTPLFSHALTEGKAVILIARNQGVIDAYLALKEQKRKAMEQGELAEIEEELAWSFGRLLSYSDDVIRRLLQEKK